MTVGRAVLAFESELKTTGANQVGVEWWVFGSSHRSRVIRRDLDLLIIYRDEASLSTAKKLLRPLLESFQVDLICMTPSEAVETKFILAQRCERILTN